MPELSVRTSLLSFLGGAFDTLAPVTLAALVVLSVVVGPAGAALGTPALAADKRGPVGGDAVHTPTGDSRTVEETAVSLDTATVAGSSTTGPTLDADDWGTAGRDPGRTGANPNASGPQSDPDARWVYAFDGDTSDVPPVVADGLVFVPGQETLRTVDSNTGAQVWNLSGLDVDSVAVSEGVVVTTEVDYSGDEIRAYRATDGTELWNVTAFEADATVISDGTLYAARGEYLYTYDLQTGAAGWSVDVNDDVSLGLSAADGTVYATGRVNDRDYAVYALNASDGRERWQFEMEGPVTMPPVVGDGSVYVGAGSALRDQSTTDHDPKFYRLNATDGHVEWMFDLNTRPTGAAVADGSVYLASGNTVHALDASAGQRAWRHRLPASLDHGLSYVRTDARSPAVADGTVYAVNNRGHVVGLDGATGTRLWQYRLDGAATELAVADDRVYAHVLDGDRTRVYALEDSPFRFSGVGASATTVAPGEQFTVDVTVENVDSESRSYDLSLVADAPFPGDRWTLDRTNGTLAPGATTTLTFTAALPSAAAWNLSVQRRLESDLAAGPVTVDVVHAGPADAWPMGGFAANRTDANPDTDGPSRHFQEAWNVSNTDEDTTPVVADGSVFVVRHENRYSGGADVHTVTAYDTAAGTVQWEYNFTAENRVPSGSPAVVDGTVYVATTPYLFAEGAGAIEHGSVYAFDAATGTRTWKQSVSINVSTGDDHGPIVADGRVYVAGNVYEQNDYYENASVVALDAATGTPVWSYSNAEFRLQDSYRTYAAGEGYVFVTAMDEIETATYEDELHVFDAATGSLAWTTDSLGLGVDQDETPVVTDGLVFVVDESTNAAGEPAEELVALDVATGAEQWRFTPSSVQNYYGGGDDGWRLRKPAVHDGTLYVRQTAYSDRDANRLHRLDAATGTPNWNASTNFLSRIQVVDGVVYGAETTFDPGYTRLYSAEDGERLGHSGQGLSLSVVDGTVYAYDDWSGRFRALVEGGAIEFTDLSVDSGVAGVGENVTVTATATNVGTLAREYDVNLAVAPDESHYVYDYVGRTGTLAPGEHTTVSWTVKVQHRGDFVFTLQPNEGEDSLERFMYDRAGSATVAVGDAADGAVVDLGGPRSLAPDAGSWPTEGFDAGNAGGSSTTAPTAVGANVVDWTVDHSNEWSSGPTVAADTVFVGGRDDSGTESVFAYDATDGSLRWQYQTLDDVEVPPAYAGGHLYAVTAYGTLYQLDATTGERLWTFDVGDDGGLAVVDDVLYVAGEGPSEDRLYALNATTRERLWTFATPDSGYGMTTPAVVGGSVYLTSDDGHTYALDAATGTERWNRSIAGAGSRLHAPVVKDGVVYVDDAAYGSTDGSIYALDAADGSTVWRVPANVDGYTGASPALANGTLYLTADGAVRALDASTGDARWNTTVCAAAEHSLAAAGGVVYVPMADSTIRAYDADTGELVWRYGAYGEASFTPAVADGVLYTTGLENADDTYSLAALRGGTTDQPSALFEYTGLTVSDRNASTGESVTVEATVRNLGAAACPYTTNLSVDGSVVDTTNGTVGTGYDDEATVTFTHAFANTGTYDVTVADLPPVQVDVSEPSADPVVSPTTRDFGDVAVGETVDRYVQITNEGTETLYIDGATVGGTDDADYRILSGPQTNVYPGDSATVWLRFAPTASGTKTASLDVDTLFSGTVTATLTGVGVGPAEVDVSPASHEFGDVEVGNSTTTIVTVSNVGGSSLSFDGASLSGTAATAYGVTDGGGTTTIPAGGAHDVTVEFAPEFTGAADATLTLSTNDTDEPTVNVALSGTGTLVGQNRPPTVATDRYTVYAGEWLNVSAPDVLTNDADPDGDSFDASHHSAPDNGTLESFYASGGFEYRPDPGFTGTDSFVYRTQDSEGEYSAYTTVTIEVLPDPNRAPEAVDDSYSVHAGQWLNVSGPGRLANDHDPDGDSFDASHHGDTDNGTLHRSAQDGSFQYLPDDGFVGTDSYVYRVQDEAGEYSSFATVTIEVLPPTNRAPTAVPDTYTVRQGTWLNVSGPGRLTNDYDVDGDTFGASHHGSPSHGTLHRSAQDGSFEYLPDDGFVGTDSYVYRIRDAEGEYSSFATVTIEVLPSNRAPTVGPDHYATLAGEWLNVSGPGRLANDYDVDGDDFDASHHGDTDNGTLHRSAQDGSFQYLPDDGFVGTDSYVYRVRDDDGEYSTFGAVAIEVVDPATTAPVAVPDHYTVYEGRWLNVSGPGRLANDLDPNGDVFSASHHGDTDNGTLHRSAQDGSFQYRPDDGFVGTDSYVYRVRDEDSEYSSFATVTIEVLPDPNATANRAPVATADRYTVYEGEWLNVSGPGRLANDRDPDGDSFDASHHGDTDDGTLYRSAQDGSFEYLPDDGFVGIDSYVYRVRDEHGTYSAFETVTIEVLPDPNRPPQAVDDSYSVHAGEWLNVSGPGRLANDRDPDGDSFGASHHGDTDNGTLHRSAQDGSFQYLPDPGFVGTDSYVYRIRDAEGEYSSFATVTIEVLPPTNRAPTAVSDEYVVVQGETLTVDAPGRLANDYDVDGHTFDASHHSDPNNGTLHRSAQDGSFSYTPDPGFVGVDSYVYRIRDAEGEYSTFVPVTVTVVDASSSGVADVVVTPTDLEFGTVPAGGNATKTVTVANVGDRNLTVSGTALSGPNASAFEVVSGTGSAVLGYGGTHELTVAYAPTATGPAEATLTVLSDDPDEPEVEVTLGGTGEDADAPTVHDVAVTGAARDGSTVYANESVDFTVDATDATGTVDAVRVTLDARFTTFEETVDATYDAGTDDGTASKPIGSLDGGTESGSVEYDSATGDWTASIPTSRLPDDGAYDVVVTAVDDRGNRRTVAAADRVVVDRAVPNVPATVTRLNATAAAVTVAPDEPVRPGSLTLDVERPDGTVVPVALTDEGGHWNGTVTLAGEGQYGLVSAGADLAGNRGNDTATALVTTASTDANGTITVRLVPSGLFVRFTASQTVTDTFVTVTESDSPLAPLASEPSGVAFLDAEIGSQLSANLDHALVGVPVNRSRLASGTDVEDVTVRFYNETTGRWSDVPTTVENVTVDGTTDEYWVATVTHFSTYGAVASDRAPPTVTATIPSDGEELPAGTTAATLRVEYADALSGVETGRVGVLFDGALVTTDPATTVTSTFTEFEATGLTDGSTHTLEVVVVDRADNTHTETLTFTVGSESGDTGSPTTGDDTTPDGSDSDGRDPEPTPTPTPTPARTPAPEPTPTPTPAVTPTATPTVTVTVTTTPTPTTAVTPTASSTASPTAATATVTTTETGSPTAPTTATSAADGPGFGPWTALLGLLLGLLGLRRRTRRGRSEQP
ncbi:Ig-like domain-containing protein [Salinirubellus salinus]|uniref:Ig-like domain-containing protein n=1 Tax=Salinirubellus salinus TaxID=1364945 RepID=A0A9E7R280_9EURY|nr:Ig-like domain-containing protein [Salinirubellus salinus]UWM54410.1 Ig-like domain-containing protein [Salinirubellus salinus]